MERLAIEDGDLSWESARAHAEQADAAHPLPQPPYRCGQIWAWKSPETEGSWVSGQIFGWSEDRPFYSAGCLLPASATRLVLLHDPLVPADAPWSSP